MKVEGAKMREIKFRMWDFETKEMIDGDSLAFEEYAPISHLLTKKGIMQFTGSKDRNGKDIYEGDIVVHGHDSQYIETIVFMDGCFGTEQFHMDDVVPCEVIGNIYKNPELRNTIKN